MKILVIGGLGTIGTDLVFRLRNRGHEVWIADLQHSPDPRSIRCDVGSYRQIARVFEGYLFDYVYHLAAEFGRWNGEEYYDTLWRTNVIGTKNIIRLQEIMGFKLIFASSSEVYGDYPGVMSEDVMDKQAIRQLNDYALTKWVSEQQIMNSADMAGTESVRVRLFNTYGPGEYYTPYRSVICRFIYHALMGMPYTVYMHHHRTSTYIKDTTRPLAHIVQNFIPGRVYNIGGTEYHDMKTVSDIILDCIGIDDSLVTYEDREPHTTMDKRVDVRLATEELNHYPVVPLKDGLKRTVDWMRGVYVKS